MSSTMIDTGRVAEHNAKLRANLDEDYAALGGMLARRGQDIEKLTAQAQPFAVALPSWGAGTGGTRFARFPGKGEPRNVVEKLEDCAVIHQLTCATPGVSLHFPWDKPRTLRRCASRPRATACTSTPSTPTLSRTKWGRSTATNSAA